MTRLERLAMEAEALRAAVRDAAHAYRWKNGVVASEAAERLRLRGLRYDEILNLVATELGMSPSEILPMWDSLMDT